MSKEVTRYKPLDVGHQAFSKLQELRETLEAAAISFIKGGRILREIFDQGLYQKDEGFYGWIRDNVGLGRSTINDMMNAHRRFGKIIEANPELKDVHPSKIRVLLPHVKDDTPTDEKLELLHHAKVLSVSDLKMFLKERAGTPLPPLDQCTHSGWLEKIVKCARCGKVLEHTRDNYEKIVEKGTDFNPNVTDPLEEATCDEREK